MGTRRAGAAEQAGAADGVPRGRPSGGEAELWATGALREAVGREARCGAPWETNRERHAEHTRRYKVYGKSLRSLTSHSGPDPTRSAATMQASLRDLRCLSSTRL